MSRRMKGRHHKVQAQPDAQPAEGLVLDDSNSDVDPFFPDLRVPHQLNTRVYVKAGTDDEQAGTEPPLPEGFVEL